MIGELSSSEFGDQINVWRPVVEDVVEQPGLRLLEGVAEGEALMKT